MKREIYFFCCFISLFFDAYSQGLSGTVIGQDGYSYKIINIGTQKWFAENLRSTKFNDGTEIPMVTDAEEWVNLTSTAYCWNNNNEISSKDYGLLYNYYVVKSKKACPIGWHVPKQEDYNILTEFLGGFYNAPNKIREVGTTHWHVSNDNDSTNISGFTSLPGGFRSSDGSFYPVGDIGYWWTSTQYSISEAWDTFEEGISQGVVNMQFGLSIRCLCDELVLGNTGQIDLTKPGFYPNPAKDILMVEDGVTSFVIYNVIGEVVLIGKPPLVNISSLQRGLFYVSITYNTGKTISQKLVKE